MTLTDTILQSAQDVFDQSINDRLTTLAQEATDEQAALQAEIVSLGAGLDIVGASIRASRQRNPFSLMQGTKANSGQKGATGTGVFTAGDIATLTCVPDAGQSWYDAGFYQDQKEVPKFISGWYKYTSRWLLPTAADLAAVHQLEDDGCPYLAGYRYHPAVALNFTRKTLSWYNGTWVDTGIPFTMTPGQWFSVGVIGRVNTVAKQFEYYALNVNGVWQPFTQVGVANTSTHPEGISIILQLDSNKAGVPFTAQATDTHLVWI